MHVVIYLLIVYGWLRYFKQNLRDGSLPNPTGPLPVFHHSASYMQKAKSKLNLINNPCDMHVHNSLSNVVIHPSGRALSIGNGFRMCALPLIAQI